MVSSEVSVGFLACRNNVRPDRALIEIAYGSSDRSYPAHMIAQEREGGVRGEGHSIFANKMKFLKSRLDTRQIDLIDLCLFCFNVSMEKAQRI